MARKWPTRLPHPYTAADRRDGVRYDISMLQAEFVLTQVFDRPVQGRVFFEEVMRENLNLGRPDHVRLIFDPRVTKRTPSRYRTRVITDGSSRRCTWTTSTPASSNTTRRSARRAPGRWPTTPTTSMSADG